MNVTTKNKPKAKSTLVWVVNLNWERGEYVPQKEKKKACENAGVEWFGTKEEANNKCKLLNCN